MNLNLKPLFLKIVVSACGLGLAFGGVAPAEALPPTPLSAVPNKVINEQSVGIQMFMWNWRSLKSECTNVLGPEGIDWMQVSPPQESVQGNSWWTHYQPVSYQIDSSLGTRQEFIDMVAACNSAGVQVIVDAVINHMANSAGEGFAGSTFTKYDYPGIYTRQNFHAGLDSNDPNYCARSISNFNNIWQATHCELGGLPDLATEQPAVQEKIVGYLNDLISIGVAGFRIDAAKHFGIEELTSVRDQLSLVNGQKPYFASEAIGDNTVNEPFTALGGVWAWGWPDDMKAMFGYRLLSDGKNVTSRYNGYNVSSKTITMVSNHDTEHHGPTSLSYRDGSEFQLANIFTLADGFGSPMLYSGYAFTQEGNGAKVDYNQRISNAVCAPRGTVPSRYVAEGVYPCMQRWNAIKGMIQWRDVAGNAPRRNNLYNRKLNVLSFMRGSAFVAINASSKKVNRTFSVGLPKGKYCDLITGGAVAMNTGGTCAGKRISVDSKGRSVLNIPAMSAVAVAKVSPN
jgi:alpha-amylase